MEKIYVAELMRITKWSSNKVYAHPLSSGFNSIDDAKKWIKNTIYDDMNGVYGFETHLLDGAVEAIENAEVGNWYPYAYSNEHSAKHARYTYSITERYI